MIKVAIADDHGVIRGGLGMLVQDQADMCCVAEAADGLEAIRLALGTRPDVVVMDVAVPRLDGIEATRQICSELPDVKVLILSFWRGSEQLRAAYAAGAAGYLVKDIPPLQILQAIRSVHGGRMPVPG